MTMRTKFKFDELGEPLCPVWHVAYEWDEDDHRIPMHRLCGEQVWCIVSLNVPVERGFTFPMRNAGILANTSGWQVKCAAGHVLAVSDGEEDAEDFDWDRVFGYSYDRLAELPEIDYDD